jgi:hypothetical protein
LESSQVEKRLAEGSITYRDYPLVKYSYELLLDSDVVGSGTLEALQHQTTYTITPDSKELKVTALSLDNKPLSGKLSINV